MEKFLERHHACADGRIFARKFPTLEAVRDALCRGEGDHEWLIWLGDHTLPTKTRIEFNIRCVRDTPLPGERTTANLPGYGKLQPSVDMAEAVLRGELTEADALIRFEQEPQLQVAYLVDGDMYCAYVDARFSIWRELPSCPQNLSAYNAAQAVAEAARCSWLRDHNPFKGNELKVPV